MRALLLVTFLLVLAACGGGQHADVPSGPGSGDGTAVPTPTPDPNATPTPAPSNPYNWTSGAVADFIVPDVSVLEQYVGRPLNFPSNQAVEMKINVDMYDVSTSSVAAYGGLIRIGYVEPGAGGLQYYHEGVFTAGGSEFEAGYNRWTTFGNQMVLRAFLEDRFGSILLVVDGVDDQGMLNGSIYFHNFGSTYAQKPPAPNGRCWLIKVGPFDCRDFLVGSGSDDSKKNVVMTSSVYPNRVKSGTPTYIKLGNFTGLDGSKAFAN